jgi:GT2 family glycosyltransferase
MPLVSVIVPAYNRAYCLGRTLESALGQSHADIEIILVDDGSTDDTRTLIRTHYGNDKRVQYLYQPNRGVAAARNTGIQAASGAFVAFLDSDDVWFPWKIELQLGCLEQYPEVGMVWTDMEAVDPARRVFNKSYLRTMYSAYQWFPQDKLFTEWGSLEDIIPSLTEKVRGARFYKGHIFSQMIMGNLVHTSTVLLRRERLEKVRGFNEELRYSGEDYDFHLRTCREGSVGFIDLATIQYQRGVPDQLTRKEYRIHRATNFLKTIAPLIQTARAEITLPQAMIDTVLAEAHSWIGEEQLDLGDAASARKNLAASICFRPYQPRAWRLLFGACLPPRMRHTLRSRYRKVKNLFHRKIAS